MATPNQLGAAKQEAGSRDRPANSTDANARTFSFGDDDHDDDGNNRHDGAPRRPINGKVSGGGAHTSTTNETSATLVRYDVEHLATFSTATSHEHQSPQVGAASSSRSATATAAAAAAAATTGERDYGPKLAGLKQRLTSGGGSASDGGRLQSVVGEPREALQQLFELEKLSGIWTQRMQIGFDHEFMLIVDCETDSVVERFHRKRVTKPEAFNHYSDIYSNIIVFNIDKQQQQHRASDKDQVGGGQSCNRNSGELHIFQCISHKAKQLVAEILTWKSAEIVTDGKAARIAGLIDGGIKSDNTDNTSEKLDDRKHTGDDKAAPESGPDAKLAEMSTGISASPSRDKQAQELRGGKEAVRKLSSEEVTKSTDNSTSSKPAVTVSSGGSKTSESPAVVPNVSVKETVQVFNQIAALREKSTKSAALNQSARPLSDASGSSSQSNSSSQQQQQQQSGASSSGGFSRAHLNSAGQSYKQRSIRASLAPKTIAGDTQNGPASSSSASSTGSSSVNHKAASSSSSSSSQPEHKSTETQATKASSRDGRTLAQHQHKLASANNSTNHTQASPLEQHNQDHGNIQHNQRQASLVNGGGKSSTGTSADNPKKSSSNRSRLPATDGHNSSSSNNNNHHHHHNHHHNYNHNQHQDVLAGANSSSSNSNSSGRSQSSSQTQQQVAQPDEQVTSNESYVSVLNHCFDDIEKFILRIQHAYAAIRELQAKRRHTKRSVAAPPQSGVGHPNGPLPPLPPSMSASELAHLVAQAQSPGPDDYFEILSKFKLAFNLLAKLKGCIHEPNAPELIHFLFTPLAIIIESARNLTPPIDPTVVGIPYLNKDALDLLSNCCTSRESDLWYSLGPNWTDTIDASLLSAARLPNSFQPIFSDGWAPVISELELIGLVAPRPPVSPVDGHHNYQRAGANLARSDTSRDQNLTAAYNGNGHPAPISSKPSKQRGGMPLSRNPIESSGYLHAEYLRDGSIDGAVPSLDEQTRAYPGNDEMPAATHKQRLARHSIPNGTRASRLTAKHSTQAAAHRRNSDFIGHHYTPQPPPSIPLTNSFIGPSNDLNGRYAAGYSTAPSNDYTELHIDDGNHHRDSHQYRAAGYLVRHGAQHAPNDQHSRRKGSKSSAYSSGQYQRQRITGEHNDDHRLDLIGHDMEREAMLADVGPAQTEWFYELKLRGALIVRVLFTRDANNDKELTVKRGEILEILDDTRKWWKARNIDLQVAHVPHTIVAVMERYQTLDELLTGSAGDMLMMVNEDQMANVDPQRYLAYRDQADGVPQGQYYGLREERHNSKNAKGAFRYF